MKIIFDQNMPWGLRKPLSHHEASTSWYLGWADLKNGELLSVAEEAGFDLFLTGDKNLRYQQNLSRRRIAIVELTTIQWPSVRQHIASIVEAINGARPGDYITVECRLLDEISLESEGQNL